MGEPAPVANPRPDKFLRQLSIATYALIVVVLAIHLLKEFAPILQPLLIAGMVAYAMLPVHRRLVRMGIRPTLAFALMFIVLAGALAFIGKTTYETIDSLTEEKLQSYRNKVEGWIDRGGALVGYTGEETLHDRVRRSIGANEVSIQDVLRNMRGVAGSFFGTLSFTLVVVIYLIFLMAERFTFPRRLEMAFGEGKAGELALVIQGINEAIINYLAVKTWISFVTGAMSMAVFLAFGIEFAFLWGVLVFLLNFIPYLGGLVALAPPVALGFLQFDSLWQGCVILGLVIGIQLFTGQYLEPKLAGRKLNLSPLLILLSLAFWGYQWGVVGMVLAVPLTVVCKLILDHIPETKPVGTLMSNV